MFSATLNVPYFIQPTAITCQSTCLKMMSVYLEREVVLQSTGAEGISIEEIWQEINTGPGRPSTLRNAHINFKWWLEKRFSRLGFEYVRSGSASDAASRIMKAIDRRMPVLVSVSHERVAGHIILVVGYEGRLLNMSSSEFRLIVHDPYGRFDPTLHSASYGKRRNDGGRSLLSGSEAGAGQNVHLSLDAVGRRRVGDGNAGHYILLIPHRG